MNKNIFYISILVLFNYGIVSSQNNQYIVNSNIGLSLREEPNSQSKKILMIPNHSHVSVMEYVGEIFSINDDGNILRGQWTKVNIIKSSKSEYIGKSGFVFSGYLKLQEDNLYSKLNLNNYNSCSFNGEPFDEVIYSFKSSNEAINIIDNIVDNIGLKRNFEIFAGNVPNASARVFNGKRQIIYSQSFMSNIINETNSYWSAIGVLAHEIGHHLNGHTLDGIGSRPPKELEADEFAGFIMYKLGATLEQAQSCFNNRIMYRPFDSKTHPATPPRLEAIAVGWQRAKEMSIQPNTKNEIEQVDLWVDMADEYHSQGNYVESLKLYRKAAEKGDIYAQYSIGDFYEEGIGGVSQNWDKAIFWYKRAASQGHPEAQFWLGTLYEDGEGVKIDSEKAIYWYTKACNNGENQACNSLKYLNKN